MKLKRFFFLLGAVLSALVNAQTDFEVVKKRVISEILESEADDASVARLIQTIRDDGSWPGINYEDLSNTGFENRNHANNMVEMGLAFNQEVSQFYQSDRLAELMNRALRFWCDNDFIAENWWYNQIGTPSSLVTLLLLMDGHLDPDLKEKALLIIGRANLDAPGARQGGDRIKIGGIAAKKGLAAGDEDPFGEIMRVINSEIKFATGDRGMQQDYSFHHRIDRVNTTYSYGGSYADVFAEWAAYVAGTEYAFTRERIEQFVDYYLDGICKQAVYGIYLEKGAMNRDISRKERFHPISTLAPERLITASDYRKDELEEIIRLRKGESEPKLAFSRFYWQSEHFVCQRPGFFTSVRMFSVRNRNMESPYNSEGLLNHHRGDGTNHLSVKGSEYLNIWPVYDWQKIPGTTVLQKPALPPASEIQKPGLTEFVGAVTDGYYGAAAFDFISPHDLIKARKSWFFFDDLYVCLGAGIESESYELPVVTTLDQSLLQGSVMVDRGQGTETLDTGTHEIENAKWVFHRGTGYIFPEPMNISLSNQEQSGRWTSISLQSSTSKELVREDVFKLWIDHGVRPQGRMGGLVNTPMIAKDVKYQYIVLPTTEVSRLTDDPGIEILVNNRQVQAVKSEELGLVQAVFYQAGELPVSENLTLVIDSPGAIILKISDGVVKEISAADPSRNLSHLHMRISDVSGVSELSIELPSGFYAGQSTSLVL
ncbi:MAG: polysaccharide lyase family 8 super-sandwich domain-containing protein [Bacteroidales bacterium]